MSEFFNDSYSEALAACDDQLESTQGLRNVYVTIFCLIVIAAVVANSTVLYIIYIRRLWSDVSVVMIGNLAVSDIFVCIFVLVPEISKWIGYWEGNIYSSLHLCRLHVAGETLFPTVTIFSLVVMSFERCRISRSKVLRNRQSHRKATCYFTLLLVWISALSASLPVVRICLTHNGGGLYYAEDWGDYMKIFIICRFVLIYMLPLLSIACFYFIMALTLRKSLRATRQLASQIRINRAGKRAQERRRRLAIMVFLLVVVFAIGWLPFYLFYFLFYNTPIFCSSIVLGHLKNFRLIFYCLLSLFNPCIVYVVGANFRRYLNDIFRCKEDQGNGYQTKKTTVTCNLGSKVVADNDSCALQNGDVDV